MAEVRWSEQAVADLEAVHRFIGRDSPTRAALIIDRITASTRQLEAFPLSGRIVPEFGREDIREMLTQNYRIIYFVHGEDVRIATVHHGARLLRPEDVPHS